MSMRTVESSITLTPETESASPLSFSEAPTMSPKNTSAAGASVAGSAARSMDHLKSCAVTGRPSWNFASGLRVNTYPIPFESTAHSCARSGTICKSGSMVSSPPNTSRMYREEATSPVWWGSRVGGSLPRNNSTPPSTGTPSGSVSVSWGVGTAVGTAVAVGVGATVGIVVGVGSEPQAVRSPPNRRTVKIRVILICILREKTV